MIRIEKEFIVETTPDKFGVSSIYQLTFTRHAFSINKGTFYCKQLKAKKAELSLRYVQVTALTEEKNKFDNLKLKISNLKPGVIIWMKNDTSTSRISKVFIRYK